MEGSDQSPFHTYLVVSLEGQPTRVVVWDTARIRIGRHFEQDIVVDDPEVSRQHALLRREGDTCTLEDLGTANGTFVNGESVRSVELRADDEIRIGACSLRFCQGEEDPARYGGALALASRLRGVQPLPDDAGGSTMLGLPADDDALWGTPPRPSAAPTRPQPLVRDLDEELGLPEKEEASDPGDLEEPDPLMASAFDLGEPLPPVGRSLPSGPAASGSPGAVTAARVVEGGPGPGGASVELTLQLDGVDPNLLRALQSLLGQRFDLSDLSLLLKGLNIR